jgi:hypothetical protein
MSEREMQSGDTETAVCHVCDKRFETQEELSKHLMDTHPNEFFSEVPED